MVQRQVMTRVCASFVVRRYGSVLVLSVTLTCDLPNNNCKYHCLSTYCVPILYQTVSICPLILSSCEAGVTIFILNTRGQRLKRRVKPAQHQSWDSNPEMSAHTPFTVPHMPSQPQFLYVSCIAPRVVEQ